MLLKRIALFCLLAFPVKAEMVMVAAHNSAVGKLSKEQISQIYLNRLKQYPTGGVPVTLMLGSGATKDEFFEKILEKTDAQARAHWARVVFTGKGNAPREFDDVAALKKEILTNPFAIAFLDRSALDASLKVIYP